MLLTEPRSNDVNTESKLNMFICQAMPVFEQLNQIVFIKDKNFVYQECNNKLVDFSKLRSKKRILHREDHDLPWAEKFDFYRGIDKKVLSGEETKLLMEVKVASGEKVPAIQTKKAITDPLSKETLGIVVTMLELDDPMTHMFLNNIKSIDKKITGQSIGVKSDYSIGDYNFHSLTRREEECLFYLLRGITAKEIAQILHLSTRTVENYIATIKDKTGCKNKADLIVKSINTGIMNVIPKTINFDAIRAFV